MSTIKHKYKIGNQFSRPRYDGKGRINFEVVELIARTCQDGPVYLCRAWDSIRIWKEQYHMGEDRLGEFMADSAVEALLGQADVTY